MTSRIDPSTSSKKRKVIILALSAFVFLSVGIWEALTMVISRESLGTFSWVLTFTLREIGFGEIKWGHFFLIFSILLGLFSITVALYYGNEENMLSKMIRLNAVESLAKRISWPKRASFSFRSKYSGKNVRSINDFIF